MSLIIDNKDHFKVLFETVKKNKPSKCYISTFNIFAGITHDGKDVVEDYHYENISHDFLELLRNLKVKTEIVVGLPYFMECRKGCPDCLNEYQKRTRRIYKHFDKWPEFKWKALEFHHSKYILFSPKYSFIGGRNLTSSNYNDLTFLHTDTKLYNKLVKYHVDL